MDSEIGDTSAGEVSQRSLDSVAAKLEQLGSNARDSEFSRRAEDLLIAFPEDYRAYAGISRVLWRSGERLQALEVIDRGLAQIGEQRELLRLGGVFSAALPDVERATAYHLRSAAEPSDRASHFEVIARLRLCAFDGAGAREALESAVVSGQSRESLRVLFAHAALLNGEHGVGRALLDDEERANGWSDYSRNIASKLQSRVTQAATRTRHPVKLGSLATAELKTWALQLNVPKGDAAMTPDHFVTDIGDMVAERIPDSRALILVFGGLAAMAPDSLPALNSYIERARINSLLLGDPQRLLFLNGLPSIGDYRTSLSWIRQLMRAWGISILYCFGASAGGYAAIRYGLDLDARRVLTFAAPTTITPDLLNGENDRRARAVLGRLLKLVPEMCVDLRGEIVRRGSAAPEIVNYYGAEMPQDAFHGRNIEGLPTVISRPRPGVASHDVSRDLKNGAGQYAAVFQEFLREAKAEAP